MKKVFAWLLSWTLFWMGDGVSRVMHLIDFFGHLYPIYNTLMCWSINIQSWAGNETPWTKYVQPDPFSCLFWKKEV